MAITKLMQGVDQFGNPILAALPQSNTISIMDFSGAGQKSQTIPAGANFVLCVSSGNVDFWMSLTGTAAVPAADNTTGTSNCELDPPLRQTYGATNISIAVGAATIISLAYYS